MVQIARPIMAPILTSGFFPSRFGTTTNRCFVIMRLREGHFQAFPPGCVGDIAQMKYSFLSGGWDFCEQYKTIVLNCKLKVTKRLAIEASSWKPKLMRIKHVFAKVNARII